MPKLEYFLAAEATSIDRDTNTISIFNVFNERRADKFPYEVPRLVLVTCWVSTEQELLDRKDMQAGLVIKIQGEPDIGPLHANFVCDIEFQHVLFELAGLLTFKRPGIAQIELLLNGEKRATHTIRAKD